jgi:hypothetical protein
LIVPGVNPRLTDAFELAFSQTEVDFLVPHLKQDVPLYIDPFLLWRSPVAEDRALHARLTLYLDTVRKSALAGRVNTAIELLIRCGEQQAVGLGYASRKAGSSIGPHLAAAITQLPYAVPQLQDESLAHIEELQLCVPNIAEDRISDIAAAVLKDWLVDFTAERARALGVPVQPTLIENVFDHDKQRWRPSMRTRLPYNPVDGSSLLFIPLRFLRHLPWINYEDYYKSPFASLVLPPDHGKRKIAKAQVLAANRAHFDGVLQYVSHKETTQEQCRPDPLFSPLALHSLQVRLKEIEKLRAGRDEAERYEKWATDLLSSALYPELEFAATQVRTEGGAHIRDLILYNDGKTEFLLDVRRQYDARQPVFEIKNVGALESEHVNQLYRYLDSEHVGRLGVLVTRNVAPRSVVKNIVDLHSAKRYAILVLSDEELRLMVRMLEAGRRPIDVVKKSYLEFTRRLPV